MHATGEEQSGACPPTNTVLASFPSSKALVDRAGRVFSPGRRETVIWISVGQHVRARAGRAAREGI